MLTRVLKVYIKIPKAYLFVTASTQAETNSYHVEKSREMAALFLFLFAIYHTQAVEYIVNPGDSKEFDGVGIGMVSRPSYCDKTTKVGDLLRVHFNGTLGDGSAFEDR